MCTCCGTHLFPNIVYSFSRGFHSIKKTHAIVHKGSCLHVVKVHISFFTNIIHSIGCASGTPPFSQRFCCAAFSHINTEPHSISAKFTHSFLTKLQMNSQGMCCQSFNKTFFWKTNHYIFINIMLQYSDWRTAVLSFSVCTFLSPPNTHFLHAKQLLSSVHAVETPFSQRLLLFKGVP